MDRWTALSDVAARQHGAVRLDQAVACGIPAATLRGQVDRRAWLCLHRGVVALPGTAATPERAIAAALLAVGDHALAGRWTAAYLWGLVRAAPTVVQVVVPDGHRASRLCGIAPFRTSTLRPAHRSRLRGLAVTSPARTLGDLAAVGRIPFLRALTIDLRQRGLASLHDVSQVCDDLRTARGTGKLRRIAWELDEERCDSILEHMVRKLLQPAGLRPHPEPLALDLGGRVLHVDIPFPEQRAGVECDGFGSHSSRSQLDTDNRRHNRLVLHGWRILRVGWSDAELHQRRLVNQVHQLLNAPRRR